MTPQEEVEVHRLRELRRAAETAVPPIELRRERAVRAVQDGRSEERIRESPEQIVAFDEICGELAALLLDLRSLLLPGSCDSREHSRKTGTTV